jgi:transposase
LTSDEKQTLEGYVRSSITKQRLVLLSKIILLAAKGTATKDISAQLNVRPTTVSQWRKRFVCSRIVGLQDAPRVGKPKHHDQNTELRILTHG